jgi:hypothetical protein
LKRLEVILGKSDPTWLARARELCGSSGIKIAGWGEDTLVVHAESPERARKIATDLASLGFQSVEDDDDVQAGLLTLSRNPAATAARQRTDRLAASDFSRRPVTDRLTPVVEASLSIVCFRFGATQSATKA